METTLLIMAAGIGSRFGTGIKQLEPVDDGNHIIMDYSIHDAIEAGFNHVVFIIRKDIEREFRSVIGDRIAAICGKSGVTVDYAFQNIEDIPVKDIKYVEAKEVIHLRGLVIPIIRLDKLLDSAPREEEPESLTVVIVKKGDKLAGLVVDNLIGQMEIVIKSLGKYININRMISGATILGDGSVALIIDANTLV